MDVRLTAGQPATVILRKHGQEKVRYPTTALYDDGNRAAVRAPWAGPPVRDFGFVRFEQGDVFTEHYWRDRWYAVKEVRTAAGERKGWYCDMVRPAQIQGDVLISEDLELDLWVPADGSAAIRLDEDEFLASGLPETDPEAARQARRAQDDLARRANAGAFAELTEA